MHDFCAVPTRGWGSLKGTCVSIFEAKIYSPGEDLCGTHKRVGLIERHACLFEAKIYSPGEDMYAS